MMVLGIEWLTIEVLVACGLGFAVLLVLLSRSATDGTDSESREQRYTRSRPVGPVGGSFGTRSTSNRDPSSVANVADRQLYAEQLLEQGDIQRAVPMLAELGEYRRAAEVMERAEHWLQAGMLYQQANRYSLAIQCFEKSDEPERAVPLLREAGQDKRASLLEAKAARRKERLDEAAQAFYEAEAYQEAGELYLELQDLERCVDSYRRAGRVEVAAQLLEESENLQWAGALYEEAKQWESAARAYAKANLLDEQVRALVECDRVCEAANLLHEERRFEDSLPLLEKVSVMSPQYNRACWMRGRVLERLGKLSHASDAYVEALKTVDVQPENVPQFIRVARAQEGAGLLGEAIATLSRVIVAGHASPKETEWAKEMSRLHQVDGFNEPIDPGIANSPTLAPDVTGGDEPRGSSTTKEWVGSPPVSTLQVQGNSPLPELGRRYSVGRALGQGGNGIVYSGHDRVLQKDVAIKLVTVREGRGQQAHEAFVHEVQTAAKLSHDNIVTIYDVGEVEGFLFFTMERVNGVSLDELLRDKKSLSHDRFLPIAVQLCDALNYAHDRQIVHRDIKPGNVMIASGDQVKLLDFGIATALDEVADQGFGVCGTPHFMSPEQISMDYIDHRTDIYSLGCMLYSVYTGDVPYPDGNVYVQHREAPIPDPRDRVPSLSESVAKVLMRCIAKNRDERFQRASEVADALKMS